MGMRFIDMVDGIEVLSFLGEDGIAGVFSPEKLSFAERGEHHVLRIGRRRAIVGLLRP